MVKKAVILADGSASRMQKSVEQAVKNGEEVMNKVPFLISKGGYFPALDHFCPPDVSFKNYMYYLELLRELGKK